MHVFRFLPIQTKFPRDSWSISVAMNKDLKLPAPNP